MTYFQANEDALKIVTGNFWTRLVQERFSVTTKRRALIATDLAVLVLALLTTRVVIDLVLGSDIVSTTASAHLSTSILGLLWLLSIRVAGAYSPRHLRAGAEEYKRVLRASFVTAGLFGAAFFIFGVSYSRAQFLAWGNARHQFFVPVPFDQAPPTPSNA